jgi:allantoinase
MIPSNPRIPFCLSTDRPRLPPPNGRPLIVHVVVNLEHWPFNEPMPRSRFEAPRGQPPWPDLANFSWVEYGLRCGVPRVHRVLTERGIAASATMNSSVIDVYPAVANLALEAGWEIVGHCVVQRSLLLEKDEVEIISESVERLSRFTGTRLRGWLGPGFAESMETPEYLKAAGIDYVYEWAVDDLPAWMQTKRGPLLAMPFGVEINDLMTYALERHPGPEFYNRCRDVVETLEVEVREQPRIMTIGLHPHIIGVPQRINYLARTLDMLLERNDTIFLPGGRIADWFSQHCKPDVPIA